MADVFTKQKRSDVMARIRSHGNKDTELALIKVFRAYKITGWRRRQALPGRPDFVFRNHRLAVFVDGCFWHGCAEHSRPPKSNRSYWQEKMIRNRARDREVTHALRKLNWRVVRIWEHDLARRNEKQLLMRLGRALTI